MASLRGTLPEQNGNGGDSDVELLGRARRGDDAAFCRLVDRHAERLYATAVAVLGNEADAEDMVQETFVGALQGLRGFRGEASVKWWLTRILLNRIAKLRRWRRLRRTRPLDTVVGGPGEAVDGGATGQAQVDIRLDVAATLAGLSEEHRTVIVLREMRGMSYNEIAETLGVARGTVESRLFRARRKLRELLGEYATGPRIDGARPVE